MTPQYTYILQTLAIEDTGSYQALHTTAAGKTGAYREETREAKTRWIHHNVTAMTFALLTTMTSTGWAISQTSDQSVLNDVQTMARVRIDDDPPGPGPIDPPIDPDPEPQCGANSRTHWIDNAVLNLLAGVLTESRLQISHTRQGEPIVGEPRTINLAKSITAAKFEELEQAQEQRCERASNPGRCMTDWYQRMTETIVYTIEPRY